ATHFGPGVAAIARFVESALGASVDECVNVAAALPGGGEHHVGVVRRLGNVGSAGVFADGEDGLPGLAAVGGFVEAAVAAGAPERTLRSDEDYVGIAGIDENPADVLALFESHVTPGFAAVVGAVDAVSIADAALGVVFAGADPDSRRIAWIQSH